MTMTKTDTYDTVTVTVPATVPATCPFDHQAATLRGPAKYASYAKLRERRVQRTDEHGGYWILSHAADVEAALLAPSIYSSQRDGVFLPANRSAVPFAGLEHDEPAHTPYRRLYARAVARPNLKQKESAIRELAEQVVGRYVAAGGGDFVQQVAVVLPVEVIALLLGLGPESARKVREVTEYGWARITTDPEAMRPLCEMVMAEVMARRAEPRDDFLTHIATAESLGHAPMTDLDVLGVLNGLIIAGHETTMNASSTLALQLARDPALRARIVADPAIIPAVVEESLRFDSSVQGFVRTLTRDVEVDGVTMREGDHVLLVYGAANHDPVAFADPGVFQADRANLKHYSFGWGLHRCVGAPVAQLELRILCELLAVHDFSVVGEPTYAAPSGGGAFAGMSSLRLAF